MATYIHDKIRKLRLVHGYTQEAFADLIGRETSTFGKLERGVLEFRLKDLELIANHFNMTLDDLLHYQETKNYMVAEGEDSNGSGVSFSFTVHIEDYNPNEVYKILNRINEVVNRQKTSNYKSE